MGDQLSNARAQEPPALVDTRTIEFGHKTIIAALEGVGVKLLNLPAGMPITHLVFDVKAGAFNAVYRDGAMQSVDGNRLAAIMIAYCIAARLPIPRAANKSVKITEHGLILRFITTLQSPPAAGAA